MRRGALAVPAGLLLVAALVWVLPWATRDRDIPAAVPSPPPLLDYQQLALRAGQSACASRVAIDPRAGELRLPAGKVGRAGPPLTVGLKGEGYRAVVRLPGGYGSYAEPIARIPAPPRAQLVRVCVRNDGPGRALLAASGDERSRSRSVAVVDGRSTGQSFALSFRERTTHTVLARLPQSLERMSVFRPGIVGPWLLWPLLIAVVLGIPLAVLLVWRAATAADDALAQPATASSQTRNSSPATSGTASRGTA